MNKLMTSNETIRMRFAYIDSRGCFEFHLIKILTKLYVNELVPFIQLFIIVAR